MPVFLSAPQIGWSFWQWVEYFITTRYPDFLRGAGVTLLISISGTLIGLVIGLLIGVVKTIPHQPNEPKIITVLMKIVRGVLQAYIEVFRGTPMIVQAMVIYYGLAQMCKIYMPVLGAGILIVSINTGAYMAEIVRGGIQAIPKGQFEAAHTLGMSHSKTMLHVILPQAVRNILPATGNEFVINIKDTSVLNVISVTELYFASKSIAGTYMAYFETFIITCAIYFALTFTVTRLLRLLEKKMEGPRSYVIDIGSSVTTAIKGGKQNG